MTDGTMRDIDLMDLDFDFEDYFLRLHSGDMSTAEAQEFDARVIGLFCRSVFSGGGDPCAIPPWAALHIAERMHKVLGGEPWDRVLPMPWSPKFSDFKRTDERAIHIFCDITNHLRANPGANVTSLIDSAKDVYAVSYETARSDYYRVKTRFDRGEGFG